MPLSSPSDSGGSTAASSWSQLALLGRHEQLVEVVRRLDLVQEQLSRGMVKDPAVRDHGDVSDDQDVLLPGTADRQREPEDQDERGGSSHR